MKKLFLLALAIPFLFASCGDQKATTQSEETKQEAKTEDKKVKMILDLDVGVDDAMALAYALADPNIDLIGVTTVYGNVSRDTSVKNALDLLALLGRKDIPVFAGADRQTGATSPYVADQIVIEIHGKNGIGNVVIPASDQKVQDQPAVDFIVEAAKKYGKDLCIVATGPQTNLAHLIEKEPKIGELVGNIVIMGGALTIPGNVSDVSEANIINDPVAANKFFTSGTPFTMVGLDVTHRTLFTKKDTQKWRDLGTNSGKVFADLVDYYIDWETAHQPELTGCALHDPLAVAVAVHPDFVTTIKRPIKVGTETINWGRTTGITEKLNDPNAANVNVAIDVDVDAFVNNFSETLSGLFKKY